MLTVVGMSPASLHLVTPAVRETVMTADVLVCGKRHLQQLPDFTGEQSAFDVNIPELLNWVSAYRGKHVVVLVSGNPLFRGVETYMVMHFGIKNMQIIPDISAVQYLCAQSGTDMDDVWLTSSHGRSVCFDELARHDKVAAVTDALCGPREIMQQLTTQDKGYYWMVISEDLAMENEQIHFLPVREVSTDYNMNAAVILDERQAISAWRENVDDRRSDTCTCSPKT